MKLPQTLNLGFAEIPTYYLYLGFAVFICTFFVWKESKKDGFDNEKVFDLYFILLAVLGLIKFFINYYAPYKLFVGVNRDKILIFAFISVSLLLIKFLSKKWRWSVYRMLDIFSTVLFMFLTYMFSLKLNLIYSQETLYILIGYVLVYLLIFVLRRKILSGALFSIFLLISAIVGQFFYKDKIYLIFYFSLITISMVNLISRTKKTMSTGKLNLDFLKNIKELLLSKEKRLKVEQQKLIEDDPYLQEGRDVGNAEEIDEAILEDRAKEEIEIKKQNIEEMQDQVNDALTKLESGTYGICDKCGNPIDKARLEAYPEATTCLKCESRAEAI